MIFRQLFEPESSTYTYLFGCPETGDAVLLDPVLETLDRDLKVLHELSLRLRFTLETHVHADHISRVAPANPHGEQDRVSGARTTPLRRCRSR